MRLDVKKLTQETFLYICSIETRKFTLKKPKTCQSFSCGILWNEFNIQIQIVLTRPQKCGSWCK